MYTYCQGTISTGPAGEAVCSVPWVMVESPVFELAELSPANLASLMAASLVLVSIAFVFKMVRKQMGK